MRKNERILALFLAISVVILSSCKTRGDLRREQELQRIKVQLAEERSTQDEDSQELKLEVSRLSGLVEELFQQNRALQEDVEGLNNRLKEVEEARKRKPKPVAAKQKPTYARAKAVFDKGNPLEAIPILKAVLNSRPSLSDKKNSQYYLAESYYATKQYGQAAIEYSQFKKSFPRERRVSKAIYRQANCFRNLKKNKEARLFYQELLDRFPKSSLVKRAKREMSSLK